MLRQMFCALVFLSFFGLTPAHQAAAADSGLLYTWEDEATGTVYYVYGPSSIHTVEYVDGTLNLYGVQSGDQIVVTAAPAANVVWNYYDGGGWQTYGGNTFTMNGPLTILTGKYQSKVARSFQVATYP
jgi:hypothetical protein